MATNDAQRKWRDKHRFVKTQLNVTTRKLVHGYLDEIATEFGLRGKAEAVAFAAFATKALMQRATYDKETAELLDVFRSTYHADRDIYA